MDERTGQQLIRAFFRALELMQLEECQTLLQNLNKLARQEPNYRGWHTYLTGILANELQRDWAAGERIFKSLLETGLDPSMRGRVLIALGRTYDYQGRWHEAINIYEQSLTVFNQPDQAVDRTKIWKNMAITLEKGFARGEFSNDALHQAVQYCHLALETLQILKNSGSEEPWLEATTWNTLGLVYRSLGDWPQATHCYERFITLSQALDDRYDIGIAKHNLGEVLQRQGPAKWSAALQAYLEALEIFQEFGDKYEQIDVVANLGSLHHDLGDLVAALAYYEQAIEIIEQLRVGVTSESGRAGYFATVADTYANVILLYLATGNQAQAFDTVERARSRAFLDLLAARSLDLSRQMEATTMTLAEVQAALPVEALLLEYFTTGLVEVPERQATGALSAYRHRFPPARTLIFAVTRDALHVYDTGLSPGDLRPRQLDSVVERHFLQPQIRRMLYDRLIAPVEEALQSKRRLYLVPHGPLHYVPFQALIAPDGETLLRETGPQLIYAPSATLLFRYGRVEPSRAPASCLTLGYNDEGTTQLHFAEDEARSIAQLSAGQAIVGPLPKKATLYSQASAYRLLHLACHGQFDPELPLASFLRLAPGETLTALDVLEHLRLHCDLATLSACESGLSQIRRGDELIGFMRAFMYAGAPALVSSLWRVNDHPTRILMEKFYQEIQIGVGFAEALKRAQLYIKHLSYQEALDVLAPLMADQADEIVAPVMPVPEDQHDLSLTGVAWQQAKAYLRGMANLSRQNAALAGSKDEQIFADPYYWAAFILIGDHGS